MTALLCVAGGFWTSLHGYDVGFKKVKGIGFAPVPASHVRVENQNVYQPAVGDKEVGLLTLAFDSKEIGNNAKRLDSVVAAEAGAVGANAAYRLSVNFDTQTQTISATTYRCIRRAVLPKVSDTDK